MINRATFAQLTRLVRPPQRPLRCSSEDIWEKLKQAIEFPLPNAFLEYGKTYGTGEMEAAGYVLQIANPLDPRYPSWAIAQCEIMRTRGDGPDRRVTRYYPEANGIFPFATDLCGGLVFFTRGGTVVSCLADPNLVIQYDCDLFGFLHGLFSGTLWPEYFPNSKTSRQSAKFKKIAWL